MTWRELAATFRLYEQAGSGEHRTLVLTRRGPGDQAFVMLSTSAPPSAGDIFAVKGSAYRLTRQREIFEGWEAEVVAQ